MRRGLPGGYELDDDPARIDAAAVHRYLSEESYWARGRTREQVEHSIGTASRVIGLFHDGRQVGFARVLSDDFWVAYLADVYVLEEHRGGGRGTALVREAVENGPQRDCRWMLHTADAHGLYEKLGFGKPDYLYMERPRQRTAGAGGAPLGPGASPTPI